MNLEETIKPPNKNHYTIIISIRAALKNRWKIGRGGRTEKLIPQEFGNPLEFRKSKSGLLKKS
jgi:hypothetical protein